MPEYLSPGVYVEETSFRGKPIQGVSTSTAGFVGTARRGLEGKPTLVTSYADFTRKYGDPIEAPSHPGDFLGHAVRGFFDNGGQRAYIVRVLGDGALAADSTGSSGAHGVVARLTTNSVVLPGSDRLRLDSLRGIDTGATVLVFSRPSTTDAFAQVHASAVAAYDALHGTVTLATALPGNVTLDWRHTYLLVQGTSPAAATTPGLIPRFTAVNRGAAGNGLSVDIRPVDRPPIRITGTHTADRRKPEVASWTADGPATGTLSIDVAPDAIRLLRTGDRVRIANDQANELVTIGNIPPVPVSFSATGHDYTGGGEVTVSLVTDRHGDALPSAQLVATLDPAGLDFTGAAPVSVSLPHAVAALLDSGARLLFSQDSSGNSDTLTVAANPFMAPTSVPVSAVVHDFSADGVDTSAVVEDTRDRLLVDDGTRFVSPARNPNEPLAITTDASGILERNALLVDATDGVLFLDMPLSAGEASQWSKVESLQTAADSADTLHIATTGGIYTGACLEIDDGASKSYATVASVDSDLRTVTLGTPLAKPIDVASDPAERAAYVRVLELELQVLDNGVAAERFTGLVWNADSAANSYPRYYVDRINDPDTGSALIRITAPATPVANTPDNQPISRTGQPIALAGGDDGLAPEDRHLIGSDEGPGARFGIESLKERDDISMVAVPGVTSEAVQSALITHCELMKYRIAVLDGEQNASEVTEILAHRNAYDSSRAAYYAPWFETLDLATGRTLEVPPSGHIMGIFARSDNERGVHKAPANEVVRNITDLKFKFTKGEQDVLNPTGVNLIREFTGRGIRVWGARTLSSDPDWTYLNVRRLFDFLEHSIDHGTQWVVFEPNNPALWDRVVRTIESFLFGVWTTGAMMGTSAKEAYFVRCDRTTMTQSDIDNGRLVCLIGIAPTKPAEFVIFRIGQFTASEPAS